MISGFLLKGTLSPSRFALTSAATRLAMEGYARKNEGAHL